MAFQRNNNVVVPGNGFGDQNSGNRPNWRSDAFINVYLPTKEGKRRKLGSIPLKLSKPAEAELIQHLAEDPSRIGALMAKAEVEFNLAEGSEGSAFDLG